MAGQLISTSSIPVSGMLSQAQVGMCMCQPLCIIPSLKGPLQSVPQHVERSFKPCMSIVPAGAH